MELDLSLHASGSCMDGSAGIPELVSGIPQEADCCLLAGPAFWARAGGAGQQDSMYADAPESGHDSPGMREQDLPTFHHRTAEASPSACPPGLLQALAPWLHAVAAPLAQAGRLFGLILSFPPQFRYEPGCRLALDRLLCGLQGLPVCVEFRNRGWFTASVFEGLRTRGIGLCISDFPRMPGYPPPCDLFTAQPLCVRLHGRASVSVQEEHRSDQTPGREDSRDTTQIRARTQGIHALEPPGMHDSLPLRIAQGSPDSEFRLSYRYPEAELEMLALRLATLAAPDRAMRIYVLTEASCACRDALALASLLEASGLGTCRTYERATERRV